jgi:hypothetical protein
MELSFRRELPPVLAEQVEDKSLLSATSRYFLCVDEQGCVAFGGEVLPALAGTDAYLWLVLTRKDIRGAALVRSMRLVRSYLQSLPWTLFAECSLTSPINNRFLVACGFTHLSDSDDRNLYRWSA